MYTTIGETINVFANFSPKGAEPLCFTWKNNDYNINSINFTHKSKDGDHYLFHYAVSANNETYKITFDPNTLLWTLDEIYLDSDFSTSRSLNDKSFPL